ncbi:MAG: aldo/keto reductase [Kutzneria sp.]|nr:aldo/keto reductase [Kutzneria sp.]
MRYTLLGDSGMRVSEFALGTMTFGTEWSFGADKEESRKQFELFAEAGGNFVDTANKYTNGTSERILGELLGEDRERFVVATKYSLSTRDGDPNSAGNSRKNLIQALDASLRRLDTEYVDLLWVHAWDFMTSPEEVMRALDDQVRAGKVSYVGISDTPAWLVARMQTIAELRGWTPFVGLQIPYSLAQREVERELVPMARGLGMTVAAWAPLAGGLLSGKYTRSQPSESEDRRLGEQPENQLRIARAVDAVADELGVPSAHVALAWLREQQGVVPILGARTTGQLKSNLDSLNVTLTSDQRRRLDEASAVTLGFPHDFLAEVAPVVLGDLRHLIDVPAGRRRV